MCRSYVPPTVLPRILRFKAGSPLAAGRMPRQFLKAIRTVGGVMKPSAVRKGFQPRDESGKLRVDGFSPRCFGSVVNWSPDFQPVEDTHASSLKRAGLTSITSFRPIKLIRILLASARVLRAGSSVFFFRRGPGPN